MIGTSLTYFLLQGPGLFYVNQPLSVVAGHQQYWSLAGLIICLCCFCANMRYQYKVANCDDIHSSFSELKDAVIQEGIKEGEITLFGALKPDMKSIDMDDRIDEATALNNNSREKKLQRLEVRLNMQYMVI